MLRSYDVVREFGAVVGRCNNGAAKAVVRPLCCALRSNPAAAPVDADVQVGRARRRGGCRRCAGPRPLLGQLVFAQAVGVAADGVADADSSDGGNDGHSTKAARQRVC